MVTWMESREKCFFVLKYGVVFSIRVWLSWLGVHYSRTFDTCQPTHCEHVFGHPFESINHVSLNIFMLVIIESHVWLVMNTFPIVTFLKLA